MEVRLAVEGAPDGGGECEDYAFAAGGLVGVFDGVTHPAGVESGCVHSPAWYVRTLAARLIGAALSAPVASLAELLGAAIVAVRGDHGGGCDLDHPGTPAATVCLVREAGERVDYLVLCDSPLVLDLGDRVEVVNDDRFSRVIADVRAAALLRGGVGTDGQRERQRWSAEQRQKLVNRAETYWIAGANPRAAAEAVVGSVPLLGPDRVRRAALLTDGASCAVDRFGIMDWSGLLAVLTNDGPAELIRRVRLAERADVAGLAQPRYKRHDDAAAAICLFNQEA